MSPFEAFVAIAATTSPVVVGALLARLWRGTDKQVAEIKVMVDGRLSEALSELRALREQTVNRNIVRAEDIAAQRPPSERTAAQEEQL